MRKWLAILVVAAAIHVHGAAPFDRFARTFKTVAELVQNGAPTSFHDAVQVLGYYAPGDGGGGTFRAVQSVTGTNYGTRIYSGSSGWSWDRVLGANEAVTPQMFGAMPDGVTDLKARVDAALAAAAALGRNFRFPAATSAYRFNGAVTVPAAMEIRGEGRDKSIIYFANAAGDGLYAAGLSGFALEGLTVTGAVQRAVHLVNLTNSVVRDCRISGATQYTLTSDVVAGLALDACDGLRIEKCHFLGNGNANTNNLNQADLHGGFNSSRNMVVKENRFDADGTFFKALTFGWVDSEVTWNKFDQGNVGAVNLASGYAWASYHITNAVTPRNIRLAHNSVTNTAGTGFYFFDVEEHTVEDNDFASCALQMDDTTLPVAAIGCNVMRNSKVIGNRVNGSGRSGISIVNTTNVVVQNNIVRNTAYEGIHLRGLNYALKVSQNTTEGTGRGGLGYFALGPELDNALVLNNHFLATTGSAVRLPMVNDTLFIGNVLSNSTEWGFLLQQGKRNQLVENRVYYSSNTALALAITNSIVRENVLVGNAGTISESGTGNVVLWNYLLANTNNAISSLGLLVTYDQNAATLGFGTVASANPLRLVNERRDTNGLVQHWIENLAAGSSVGAGLTLNADGMSGTFGVYGTNHANAGLRGRWVWAADNRTGVGGVTIKLPGTQDHRVVNNSDLMVWQVDQSGPLMPAAAAGSRALVLDGTKRVTTSTATDTEVGYLSGVTSPLQTQLNGKAADPGGNGLVARTGSGTSAARTITGNTEIVVANGDGVAGNPTLSIGAALTRDTEWDTSAEIAANVTDETGSGALVFGTSPALTTPTLAGATLSGTAAHTGRTTYHYATLSGTTIDCSAADAFLKVVTTGETYSFANTPGAGSYQVVTVRLFNNSGGTITPAFTGATFPAALSTIAASKYREYTFIIYGDGVIHGVEQGSF